MINPELGGIAGYLSGAYIIYLLAWLVLPCSKSAWPGSITLSCFITRLNIAQLSQAKGAFNGAQDPNHKD